jgi:hypothetical protein
MATALQSSPERGGGPAAGWWWGPGGLAHVSIKGEVLRLWATSTTGFAGGPPPRAGEEI